MTELIATYDHPELQSLEESATRAFSACGEGRMVLRSWCETNQKEGASGEPQLVVLLHGGAGSWMHWAKNIAELSANYELLVPDLPGLGESASMPKDAVPDDVATVVANGLRAVIGSRRFHLIGFSWGSVVSALVASQLGQQIRSIMVVGPASTGKLPGQPRLKSLVPRSSSMSTAEISAVNTENLGRLMIFDRQKIDSMAVELHNRNTKVARYNSPKFSKGDYLLQGLAQTTAPLLVLYGDQDAVSVPFIAERKKHLLGVRADLQFETVEQAGHWLQYERADWFNRRAMSWIEENSSS